MLGSTGPILSIAVVVIVVGFIVFSLYFDRSIVDGGDLVIGQGREVLVSIPVGNVRIIFTFECSRFDNGNRDSFK